MTVLDLKTNFTSVNVPKFLRRYRKNPQISQKESVNLTEKISKINRKNMLLLKHQNVKLLFLERNMNTYFTYINYYLW